MSEYCFCCQDLVPLRELSQCPGCREDYCNDCLGLTYVCANCNKTAAPQRRCCRTRINWEPVKPVRDYLDESDDWEPEQPFCLAARLKESGYYRLFENV